MAERKSDESVINYGFECEAAEREARRESDKGVIACERYRAKV